MGECGGLGQEEVGDDQQIERAQPPLDATRIGRGDGDVGAEDQQPANAVTLAHRRQHLERRLAGARQVLFSMRHTAAMWRRASGSSIRRYPGS